MQNAMRKAISAERDALPLYCRMPATACSRCEASNTTGSSRPASGARPFPRCRHILWSAIIEVWVTEYGYLTKLVFMATPGQPGRLDTADPTPSRTLTSTHRVHLTATTSTGSLSATEEEMIGIVEKTLSNAAALPSCRPFVSLAEPAKPSLPALTHL